MKNTWLKDSFNDSIPIIIGYFPIAVAFGILAKSANLSLLETTAFSLFVFAGASQFIAINLLLLGANIGEIVITTFLVNLRHLLMSASLSVKVEGPLRFSKAFLAFGITDEVFSVASFKNSKINKKYLLTLEFLAYSSWVSGSAVGFIAGSLLPSTIQQSMGIALYGMFVALLIPEIKKSRPALILALSAGVMNSIFKYIFYLKDGWSIILSVIIVSFIGSFIYTPERVKKHAN